jgi:hypothetical protein
MESIVPAPEVDILFEQLEYLVTHSGTCHDATCPDCARLRVIKLNLLQPFRVSKCKVVAASNITIMRARKVT